MWNNRPSTTGCPTCIMVQYAEDKKIKITECYASDWYNGKTVVAEAEIGYLGYSKWSFLSFVNTNKEFPKNFGELKKYIRTK